VYLLFLNVFACSFVFTLIDFDFDFGWFSVASGRGDEESAGEEYEIREHVLADLEFGSQEEAGPLSFFFFFLFDLKRFHHDHHVNHFSVYNMKISLLDQCGG
jgi:hypothetical protein